MISPTEFLDILHDKKLTIATAESITAGLLSSTIASVSGASTVLKGGIVCYNPEVKINLLNVDPNIIKEFSAESFETTIGMVNGLSKIITADIHVAITGVASKSVNDYKLTKPVGQIYVAILFKNELFTFETIINENSRNEIREKSVEFIFEKVISVVNNQF